MGVDIIMTVELLKWDLKMEISKEQIFQETPIHVNQVFKKLNNEFKIF